MNFEEALLEAVLLTEYKSNNPDEVLPEEYIRSESSERIKVLNKVLKDGSKISDIYNNK